MDEIERFLCIASFEKGHEFLRQCAQMGVRPTLLTLDTLRDAAWPNEAIEDIALMPAGLTREQILNTACWMSRGRRFDRVVALDEFDLATAAHLREHMRIPGMGITTAAYYRDKLAMRMSARDSGFLVPQFCRVLNYDELREFMERVPAPWLLKPRTGTSAAEVRRIEDPEQLWRALDELADGQSQHLLEESVSGEIFHVDSILNDRDVLFSVVHQYGRPSAQTVADGGVFTTLTLDRGSREWLELTALNAGVAPSFGMVRGVTHAQYIRDHRGRYYFIEIGARVGGGFIADLVEVSTGVNLWREWARLEVGYLRGEAYVSPESFESYAGSVVCLAENVELDQAAFNAPEIVVRMEKNHHAGLILRSATPGRVKELVERYSGELARRFPASQPPMD